MDALRRMRGGREGFHIECVIMVAESVSGVKWKSTDRRWVRESTRK